MKSIFYLFAFQRYQDFFKYLKYLYQEVCQFYSGQQVPQLVYQGNFCKWKDQEYQFYSLKMCMRDQIIFIWVNFQQIIRS
jgi:hypothetical protein